MNDFAFHIDPNDMSARRCSRPLNCLWGEPNEHYVSEAAARAVAEQLVWETMNPRAWVRFHKRSAGQRHVEEFVKPVR